MLRRVAPGLVNDTAEVGRAMVNVAAGSAGLRVAGKRTLSPREIAAAADPLP